ncbi:MAG: MBOAT family O-acyltransferase [Candidatus Heteroscillospira sp.]|jgi:alginate O-acetyltransferase complex protein AlgI
MVFSSATFLLLFLPLFLGAYYLTPSRGKNTVLFLFSLLFYSWGEPVYVVLMIFSTVLDYTCGLLVDKYRGERGAKAALLVSVFVNLGLLGLFKYSDFLITSLNALIGWQLPAPGLALPIGISFYTFQTMSYTIDVYRGDARVQRNILSFGAYVSLFPQLIAGPIVRYQTVADQIDCRTHTVDAFGEGVRRFVCGLGKKVLLANNIGLIWESVSKLPESQFTVLGTWLGLAACGLQIYFDFSGYSDMAIGLGKMLGFQFLENFNYPFISKSVTEFWRRWHISLGTWFRDYVYVPLGGNRRGWAVQLHNIAVVWLLTGAWHGASWNFVLWGAYYGAILIMEKCFLLNWLDRAPAVVGHLYTLCLVTVSWALFSVEDLGRTGAFLRAMFGGAPLWNTDALYLLTTSVPLLLAAVLAATPLAAKGYRALSAKLGELPLALADCTAAAGCMVLCTAYLISGSYNPFLYFRF